MKRLLHVMAAGLILGLATPASAYSKIIVFGDSLVDSGNAARGAIGLGLPNPAPPEFGYYKGRFSNGYNFADYLSLGYFGNPAKAYLKGGDNMGVGGATALLDPPALPPSFLEQLALFQGTGHAITDNTLVLLTFGGNDIRDVLADPLADFTQNLIDFQTGLTALLSAGAKNVVVTGVADIGALPSTMALAAALGQPGLVPLATSRTLDFNSALAGIAAQAALLSGADVDFFDLYGLEQALKANPAAFGMPALDASLPCQLAGAGAVLSGCNGYLYFDAIHPTTQIHAVIAGQIALQLGPPAVPEPASWAMLIAGFAAMGGMLRARRTMILFG